MAQGSASFHEDRSLLRSETMDRHRATVSLMEELEAIDWYDQRIDASDDDELREVLRHNRDEEKEHAAMTLEWLRRNDPQLDGFLRTYLFADGAITAIEEEVEGGTADAGGSPSTGSTGRGLGIGSLRDRKEVL